MSEKTTVNRIRIIVIAEIIRTGNNNFLANLLTKKRFDIIRSEAINNIRKK